MSRNIFTRIFGFTMRVSGYEFMGPAAVDHNPCKIIHPVRSSPDLLFPGFSEIKIHSDEEEVSMCLNN